MARAFDSGWILDLGSQLDGMLSDHEQEHAQAHDLELDYVRRGGVLRPALNPPESGECPLKGFSR